jgi:hypothetical protein
MCIWVLLFLVQIPPESYLGQIGLPISLTAADEGIECANVRPSLDGMMRMADLSITTKPLLFLARESYDSIEQKGKIMDT